MILKLSVPVTWGISLMSHFIGVLVACIMFSSDMWECMHLVCHIIIIWMIWYHSLVSVTLWQCFNVGNVKDWFKQLISVLLKCFAVLFLHFFNKSNCLKYTESTRKPHTQPQTQSTSTHHQIFPIITPHTTNDNPIQSECIYASLTNQDHTVTPKTLSILIPNVVQEVHC